jgi:putative transposase
VGGELPNRAEFWAFSSLLACRRLRDLITLFLHLIVTVARLAGPGGTRSVVAESVLVKHQLLILNRSRKRAPNLRASDRIIAGLCALLMRRARVLRSAIVLKPSTLLNFHHALKKRKYRRLFSPKRRSKPGRKGPNKDLIDAIVDIKRRNPNWGCPRIAQQMTLAFSIEIDRDTVRRILSIHYRPEPDSGGPSWLTFLGHRKDSLWSLDLFRCESATLRTLGSDCDGPIHASNCRVWCSARHRGWAGAVPDV